MATPGQPGPQGQPGQPGQGGDLTSIMTVLAGAGFKSFFDIVIKAKAAGVDISQFMSQPGLPKLLMGIGLKDAANSENVLKPISDVFNPPQQQQEQIDPAQLSAAMAMLSSRLGPGLQGIQAPIGGPPELGSPGSGVGIQPPGIGLA